MLKLTDATTGDAVYINSMQIISFNRTPGTDITHIVAIGNIQYEVKESPEYINSLLED